MAGSLRVRGGHDASLITAAVVVLVMLAVGLVSPTATASTGSGPSVAATGEHVIVQFEPGTSAEVRRADLERHGLEPVEQPAGSDFALAAPAEGQPTVPAPGTSSSIEAVDPVVTYEAFGIPNDPAYPFQWHLDAIGAVSAWGVTTGAGTVVAVIDTGVAYEDHGGFRRAPDLAGTAFVAGWDFVDDDAHPNDESGHGTHVASIIAATTNNGVGGAGVAPGVTIMPLRILGPDGKGSDWAAAQAIIYAADHGADVANLSFGGSEPSPVVAEAVTYARGKGMVVVAAAGNRAGGGAAVSYPAADDGVIAVGAVRYDRTRASYSNFGLGLDLVAPGGDSTVDQNGDGYGDGILAETFEAGDPTTFGYAFMSGTSMAAPQVSAVAALVVARGLHDPDRVAQVLNASARDLGPVGWDEQYGAGLLRSAIAVRLAAPVAPDVRGSETACPSDAVPRTAFTDIDGTVHATSVRCVAWWGVAQGTTASTFTPSGRVTRAQMASFVARMIEEAGGALPPSPPDAFVDDETSVHELRINQLAALGVVRGRTAGVYAPADEVTRAEMATFLARAHDVVAGSPLAAGVDRFTDDDTSVHEANIDKVAAAGLAVGNTATTFAPSSPVLRGQMASFLARTLDLFVATGVTAPR